MGYLMKDEGNFNGDCLTNVMSLPFIGSLNSYFTTGCGTIYVIVPFISNSTLVELLSGVDLDRDVCIVTSWRIKHLQDGVSSLELYPICKKMGWSLYINSNLHAKIYSNSFDSMVLSSANCTESALCKNDGNLEFMILVTDMRMGYRIELNRIIAMSTLVDDSIYDYYCDLINDSDEYTSEPDLTECCFSGLYINQLPTVRNPVQLWEYLNEPASSLLNPSHAEHDLALYYSGPLDGVNRDCFLSNVGRNFLKHPFIRELDIRIDEDGMRFGEFKELVQKTCRDTPVPYRKDLTSFIQNLYVWFTVLFPESYYVDIPGRRSEVLHRR